ncbi:hypothetical protein CYMTET_55302 [Cymbomonas tetramitiformis]|uniref:Uncharacterized protein n=1 Tax=Cymbomonas tetramitiformis TaxID=36881 RepID=A0AAE0BD98_9CHLO|nr:hypothetical protein CYMTET_55302 [Cymbomonas tetramitiformis]
MTVAELHDAADRGDLEALSSSLEDGTNVNSAERTDGRTALHISSERGNLSLITFLIDNGANTALRDHQHSLPVHDAAKRGHTEIVEYFVKNGFATVREKSRDWELLHLAAFEGHEALVVYLLSENADPCIKGAYGTAALSRACYCKRPAAPRVVQLLLDAGANVNACDHAGRSALHVAAERGAVHQLLERGAAPNAKQKVGNCCTPLMLAAQQGGPQTVAALLAADNIHIQATDTEGSSALHYAALSGSLEAVEALLYAPGSDPAQQLAHADENGQTAYCKAVSQELELALSGEPWCPRAHHLFPKAFKDAAQCLLLGHAAACRAHRLEGHLEGLGVLPREALVRILEASAFPLCRWTKCTKPLHHYY